MNLPFFADSAYVEIEGEQALDILEADYHSAMYQVRGFSELQIFLTDHRAESVVALQQALRGEGVGQFGGSLNALAFVVLTQIGERAWMIDLYETREHSPINTLEIGVGVADPLPVHNYHLYHYEPAATGAFHFFSVYQNDPELIPAFSLAPAFAEI